MPTAPPIAPQLWPLQPWELPPPSAPPAPPPVAAAGINIAAPGSSFSPCVRCGCTDAPLAVNIPCDHAFMCRACAGLFREINGEICNFCRQPATLSQAQHVVSCLCGDDVAQTRDLVCFAPCCHMCCADCAVMLVRAALGNVAEKLPFRCEFCRASSARGAAAPPPMPIADLLRRLPAGSLTDGEIARFLQCNQEAMLPANQRVYCPAPGCGAMMPVAPNAATHAHAAGGEEKRCRSCRISFCVGCRTSPWHAGVTCDQHRGADAATEHVIRQTTKPCPHCGLRATHFRGHNCHHIVCPACRGHWCYSCGQQSAPETHRCETPRCQGRLFCDDTCNCPDCPDCAPGRPCGGELACPNDGRCRVCQPPPAG